MVEVILFSASLLTVLASVVLVTRIAVGPLRKLPVSRSVSFFQSLRIKRPDVLAGAFWYAVTLIVILPPILRGDYPHGPQLGYKIALWICAVLLTLAITITLVNVRELNRKEIQSSPRRFVLTGVWLPMTVLAGCSVSIATAKLLIDFAIFLHANQPPLNTGTSFFLVLFACGVGLTILSRLINRWVAGGSPVTGRNNETPGTGLPN